MLILQKYHNIQVTHKCVTYEKYAIISYFSTFRDLTLRRTSFRNELKVVLLLKNSNNCGQVTTLQTNKKNIYDYKITVEPNANVNKMDKYTIQKMFYANLPSFL